jgi:2,5-diamino-6-(ribosylamino)-4(3H)-pyrimidinone 5'-phosphate reductase
MKNDIEVGLPWVILHNTMTLDGTIKGFEADLDIHYRVAAGVGAQGYLVGSQTVLDAFYDEPVKEDGEYIPGVDPTDKRPFWIVVDSKGKLINYLDFFRKLPYIKEIIVLISRRTPKEYIKFLKRRKYPYILSGEDYVDYKQAFRILRKDYQINRLLTDTGNLLNRVLFELGLINAISLVIAPLLLDDGEMKIFSELSLPKGALNLQLYDVQKFDNNYLWLRYHIE